MTTITQDNQLVPYHKQNATVVNVHNNHISDTYQNHPCYQLLLGCKHVIGNKSYRTNLISSILSLDPAEYLHASLCDTYQIVNWYQLYSTNIKNKNKWGVAFVSRCLCEFDEILQMDYELNARDISTFPSAIQDFKMFMLATES